jgi:hypothetical protein
MMFGATAVADPPRVTFMATFASNVTTRETDIGTHVISGIRIFKAGTFADSMGIVRTWSPEHLDQMVLHYNLLKQGGYLPNVPIREDHSFSVRGVCGYFMSVYRDASDDQFLAADIEITEPDAFEKWQRGTYRSRSLEIGVYETNGEEPAMYFPVIMGLAFVDIPAVEGLHRANSVAFPQAISHNKEKTMTDEEKAAWTRAAQYAQALADWERAASYAQACADWEAAVNYAQALNDHQTAAQSLGLTADHRAGAPVVFTINGAPTADGTAVQSHITGLETFRQESINAARQSFVDGLAAHGKIGQPQVESMKALVLTMDDTQYAAFESTYNAQGASSLFGNYGQSAAGGGNPNGQPGGGSQTTDEEIATLEEIIATHGRAGKTQEQIEAMPSFKKLTDLKARKAQG